MSCAELLGKENRLPFAAGPFEINTESLLLALLEESECRAAEILGIYGIEKELVWKVFFRETDFANEPCDPIENESGTAKLESPISAPPFPQGSYGIVYGPEPPKPSERRIVTGGSMPDRDPTETPYQPLPELSESHIRSKNEKSAHERPQPLPDDFNLVKNIISSGLSRNGSAKSSSGNIKWFLEGESMKLARLDAALESAVLAAYRRVSFPEPPSRPSLIGGGEGRFVKIRSNAGPNGMFELATEHLLLAVTLDETAVGAWLREQGLDPTELYVKICEIQGMYALESAETGLEDLPPLPFEEMETEKNEMAGDKKEIDDFLKKNIPNTGHNRDNSARISEVRHSVPESSIARVLDAAANRAGEAFRVIEDYVRFVLDNQSLCETLKEMRGEFAALVANFSVSGRLSNRDTEIDVGTKIEGENEYRREGIADLLGANFSRLQESLRSLEEYSKISNPAIARGFEQLRYRSYTLQKVVNTHLVSPNRLDDARIYVLIDCRETEAEFIALISILRDAGVDVLQLREKNRPDRTILSRARILREMTAEKPILFIMNDRADLALLTNADGIHIGQDELNVRELRSILGPEMIIGVSTHDISQVRQAILDGANYIGLGPVFPSKTKSFEHFPGPAFLKEAAREIHIPGFAIGGIDLENIDEVLATGTRRVALGSAVLESPEPAFIIEEIKRKIVACDV